MSDCDRCPHGIFKEVHCHFCEIMNHVEYIEEEL